MGAVEREMRKKMREDLEAAKAAKREEEEDREEDDEELLSEEERVLEAKAKMKETQKILQALEKAANNESESESEDERRKRIERKANENILKKKTENMKLLD